MHVHVRPNSYVSLNNSPGVAPESDRAGGVRSHIFLAAGRANLGPHRDGPQLRLRRGRNCTAGVGSAGRRGARRRPAGVFSRLTHPMRCGAAGSWNRSSSCHAWAHQRVAQSEHRRRMLPRASSARALAVLMGLCLSLCSGCWQRSSKSGRWRKASGSATACTSWTMRRVSRLLRSFPAEPMTPCATTGTECKRPSITTLLRFGQL